MVGLRITYNFSLRFLETCKLKTAQKQPVVDFLNDFSVVKNIVKKSIAFEKTQKEKSEIFSWALTG